MKSQPQLNPLNQILLEKALREQEKRRSKERESLTCFIEYFFRKELNKPFETNWHHKEIEAALLKVLSGEITRLIINIPPGSGKTELITKCFPVWAMGKKEDFKVIATGYSATLTQSYGAEARDYYKSDTYLEVFPRRQAIREDQDTKGLWKTEKGAQYLATGVGGSITGNRANCFIIDDPLKPDEAYSDVKREAVNRWYDNTVLSRLFNADKDSVIIVMQRTHEEDLCGYLLSKPNGEKWHVISVKAIAESDEPHRQTGESYHETRMPLTALEKVKSNDPTAFTTQYQQEPINKDTQLFHEEFFTYYEEPPKNLHIFTVIDPAFKTKKENDETAIITGGFLHDELYILEITHGRYNASDLISKAVYHANKWKPLKIGVEAFAAQTVLAQWLKKTLNENSNFTPIEEIRQTGDKITKIRILDAPLRQKKIKWKITETALETQLKKFPRGAHDDIIDTLQMLYSMYAVKQKPAENYQPLHVQYDALGRPTYNTYGY